MKFILVMRQIQSILAIWMVLLTINALDAQDRFHPNRLMEFEALLYDNPQHIKQAFRVLEDEWEPGFIPFFVDLLRHSSSASVRIQVQRLLVKFTGEDYGQDHLAWLKWWWSLDEKLLYYYADFKAKLNQHLDPLFYTYFYDRQDMTTIRMDEIVWGGVRQDGIPPLRGPKMISARQAKYLDDTDIVFGISINGDHRAYPKRILAWHELFVDKVGGMRIAGVYCTLCGTVIAYSTTSQGVDYELGTSGFLYRSNKLMYDKKTQSLWNTIEGAPVVGPLVNQGIELNTFPIVTTTWAGWKERHPTTKVLSLDTGHQRDYGEGVAYANYFSTDQLMFPVPQENDQALANKDEVFVLRVPGYHQDPIAIDVNYLHEHTVTSVELSGHDYVIVTDRHGASRAYDASKTSFVKYDGEGELLDDAGNKWTVDEYALYQKASSNILQRVSAHRIFWFAWYNAYPSTRLVR